ncbi:hypothetical protein EI427_20725 [Flammeovirga pectinis]|uniref:TerB family tellurite resistance protein n=1 Tax=Flammeovirga pectinis TaxID=2494373 RepID=A0A3Q9FRD4_9BACT|nr:hypothetical protein [Flammeovirga pectinis]AZQ64651.1 hypothetical protein EI427_20725 [Flammeovirga pectinis]
MLFEKNEKKAVVKVVNDMMLSDGVIDVQEVVYLSLLKKKFKFDDKFIEESKKLTTSDSVSILKGMPDQKKEWVMKILFEMANVDNDFDANEKILLENIRVLIDYKG